MVDQTSADRPSPFYQGVERLAVRCLVTTGLELDRLDLERRLCELARAMLEAREAKGQARPVVALEPVDPRLLDPGTLTALLRGHIHPAAEVMPELDGVFMALALDLHREIPGPSGKLFPAPPQVVFAPSAAAIQGLVDMPGGKLTEAIGRLLDAALPQE